MQAMASHIYLPNIFQVFWITPSVVTVSSERIFPTLPLLVLLTRITCTTGVWCGGVNGPTKRLRSSQGGFRKSSVLKIYCKALKNLIDRVTLLIYAWMHIMQRWEKFFYQKSRTIRRTFFFWLGHHRFWCWTWLNLVVGWDIINQLSCGWDWQNNKKTFWMSHF